MSDQKLVWSATEIDAVPFDYQHPLEESASLRMYALSRMTGLKRAAVSVGRIKPGKCSFPKHRHHAEEEWIYILSGQATLTLEEDTHVMDPGAFAAFPAAGPAHKLENQGSEDLVYLMGGENLPVEIVDFPDHGKRLNRTSLDFDGLRISDSAGFAPYDPFARSRRPGGAKD